MEHTPPPKGGSDGTPPVEGPARTVYLLTYGADSADRFDSVGLLELWEALRASRWLLVGLTMLAALAAAGYAFLAPEWYRSSTLLVPAQQQASSGLAGQLGGLGGLASLAGIEIGSGNEAEAVAVLRSRELVQTFIEQNNLIPVIFADKWDAVNGRWRSADESKWPDVRDAVKVFDERIRLVETEAKTGLVSLHITWHDPELAAAWANGLVQLANERIRERDRKESELRVAFLREGLATANVVALQQSLGRLLETELQKLMLVRARPEYAFRVIDRADVPKRRFSPKRLKAIAVGGMAGAMAAVLLVLLRLSLRRLRHGSH